MQKVSRKILLTKDPDNFNYVYFFLKENFGLKKKHVTSKNQLIN